VVESAPIFAAPEGVEAVRAALLAGPSPWNDPLRVDQHRATLVEVKSLDDESRKGAGWAG
jgi:hypothetical protein